MRVLLTIDSKERMPLIAEMFTKFIPLFEDDFLFIDIFHCYEPPTVNAAYMKHHEEELQKREQRRNVEIMASIEKYVEEYLKLYIDRGILVNSILKTGNPVDEIKKQIEALDDYELLVFTPKEKDALEVMFNGRVSSSLMDVLDIPILILPKTLTELKDESKFVFLIEDENQLSSEKYDILKKIPIENISYLHFQIGDEKMEDYIEVVKRNNLIEGIREHNHTDAKNCVYILHHATQKGLLSRFTSSSVAKKLLNQTNAPLLILHKQS